MKKVVLIIIVLAGAFTSVAQNNVYGKKVVGLDSLVSDTIRARTQAVPYIEGFGTGVAGNNTEIQFNDNGVFGASSDLTWDGDTLTVNGIDFTGSTMTFTSGLPIFNSTLGGGFSFRSFGSVILNYNSGQSAWDFENRSIDDVNDGNFTIVNAGNLNLNGNTMSSSTGSIVFSDDLESSASVIDMNDNDIREIEDLGFSTSTSSNDIKTTTSAISATAQDTGNDPIRRNNYYVLTPLSSVANRPLQTWANNSVDVMTLQADGSLDVTGNATFSGRVQSTTNSAGATEGAFNVNVASGQIAAISLDEDTRWWMWNGDGTQTNSLNFSRGTNYNSNSPTLTLQSDNATFSGDVSITGSLSKGSGTFKITHPLDTGKWLYHSFVEAPRADNIYRGQVELYRGIARVRIDTASNMMAGTFEALNQNVQVFVTNNDTWDLVRGYYSNGIIYIECQNELSRAVVDWLVIGERKDQTVIDWNLTDENGQLIPEWNKQDEN